MTREITIASQPLRDELGPWFDDWAGSFDIEAICTEYANAVEARMQGTPGFESLSWGANHAATIWAANDADHDVIVAAFEEATTGDNPVDLEPIAERHEVDRSEEFRTIRQGLGVTGEWLADRLGVADRTVRRWESGSVSVPDGVWSELEVLEAEFDLHVRHGIPDGDGWAGGSPEVDDPPAGWRRAVAWQIRRSR